MKYTKEHEWLRVEGDLVVVGITEHAATQLGDVVFVELPEPETASESETSDLRKLSTEELQILLDDAVREEDYDTAMEIQEELKRRNKKID